MRSKLLLLLLFSFGCNNKFRWWMDGWFVGCMNEWMNWIYNIRRLCYNVERRTNVPTYVRNNNNFSLALTTSIKPYHGQRERQYARTSAGAKAACPEYAQLSRGVKCKQSKCCLESEQFKNTTTIIRTLLKKVFSFQVNCTRKRKTKAKTRWKLANLKWLYNTHSLYSQSDRQTASQPVSEYAHISVLEYS